MVDTRPISIFLSHKRNDAGEVEHLQRIVEAHGLGTWRDLRDLSLGTDTRAEVTRVIEEESEAFLLYLTRRTLSPGFVWDVEVPAALGRRASDPGYLLIPVARGVSWREIATYASGLGFSNLAGLAGVSVPGRLARQGAPPSSETIGIFVKQADRLLRTALAAALRRAGRDRTYETRLALLTEPANPEGDVDLILDWRPMYNGRRPSRLEWDEILGPALASVQAAVASSAVARTVRVPLYARLPAAIAFGYAFRLPTGFRVLVEARGRTWDSQTRGDGSQPLSVTFKSGLAGARDVSVEVSISQDVSLEATGALAQAGVTPGRRLSLAPPSGASTASVQGAVHGASMVEQTAQLLRDLRGQPGVETIHLFIACPAPMALFLGQRLNSLGPLHTYQRANDGGAHVPAWILGRGP